MAGVTVTSFYFSLQVIGAIGNSLTAGLFIRGIPVEYKGLAFTGGMYDVHMMDLM